MDPADTGFAQRELVLDAVGGGVPVEVDFVVDARGRDGSRGGLLSVSVFGAGRNARLLLLSDASAAGAEVGDGVVYPPSMTVGAGVSAAPDMGASPAGGLVGLGDLPGLSRVQLRVEAAGAVRLRVVIGARFSNANGMIAACDAAPPDVRLTVEGITGAESAE